MVCVHILIFSMIEAYFPGDYFTHKTTFNFGDDNY